LQNHVKIYTSFIKDYVIWFTYLFLSTLLVEKTLWSRFLSRDGTRCTIFGAAATPKFQRFIYMYSWGYIFATLNIFLYVFRNWSCHPQVLKFLLVFTTHPCKVVAFSVLFKKSSHATYLHIFRMRLIISLTK
jgi:hypothetical protein